MAINGWDSGPEEAAATAKEDVSGWGDDTRHLKAPSEANYAQRVMHEIPGALEGSARMLGQVPAAIGGGVAGAVAGAVGGPDAASAVQEAVGRKLDPSTYFPDTEGRTQAFQDIMGATQEKAGELGQMAGEHIPGVSPEVGGSIGQFAGQAALNFMPIPGAEALGRALRPKPRIEAPLPPAPPKPAPYEAMPADLFGTDQPSPIPPGVRSPYNLTPEQIQAGTRDMMDTAAQAGRQGQPQGDLFQTPQEELQQRLQPGQVGARDKPEADFIPQDRPEAPGIAPLTQPHEDFFSREPTRTTPPTTIEYKPGGPDPLINEDGSATAPKPGETQKAYSNAEIVTMKDYGALPPGTVERGIQELSQGPKAAYTELIPTDAAWAMRDHNRLLELKSPERWKQNEAEYRNGWQWDPVEIKYSTADGKAVVTNGNHRVALNVKYGVKDTAARVTVTDKPLTGTEARTGQPVSNTKLPTGDASPSDIGLPGQSLDGKLDGKPDGSGQAAITKVSRFTKTAVSEKFGDNLEAKTLFDKLDKKGWSTVRTREDGTRYMQVPLREVLKHVASKDVTRLATDPYVNRFLKTLANKISGLESVRQTSVGFEFDEHSSWIARPMAEGTFNKALHYASKDAIAMHPDYWTDWLTIMHESVHAALAHEQILNPDSPFSKGIRALYTFAVKDLKTEAELKGLAARGAGEAALDISATSPEGIGTNYGFHSDKEFLAEITNPKFIDLLQSMTLDKDQVKYLNDLLPERKSMHSYWDAFKNFVVNLFGRPYNEASLFDQLLRVTTRGLDTVGHVVKTPELLKKLDEWASSNDEDIAQAAQERGAKGLIDGLRQFKSIADKPLKEIMDKFTPDKVEDISDNFRVAAYANIDRVNSILAEGYRGAGEMLKWVTDKMSTIDRTKEVNIEAALKGDKFEAGPVRGFTRRLWGEDGALTLWRKTDKGELRGMLTEWLEAQRTQRDAMFPNDRQFKVFDTVQKQLTKALEVYNAARVKAGMKAIDPIKNYFPSMVQGDYRVLVRDSTGTVKAYFARSNVYEARKLAQMFKDAHPDLDVSDPYHLEADKYKLQDLSAFEQTMRVLGADDPMAKAVQKVYADVISHRGAGAHGIKKEFVHGFMGSEAGDVGVRNAEKAIEAYIKRMYTAAANLEKMGVKREIAEMPLDMREKLKHTIDYTNDYIEHSRGGDLTRWGDDLDAIATWLSKKAGFGAQGAYGGISNMTSIMGAFWLFTEKFAFTQIPQHLNAMAKMVQLRGRGEFGNPIAAYFGGIKNAIMPDAHALAVVDYARRNGHLNPVVAELVHTKLAETSLTDSMRDMTRWTLGKIEQELVRLPTLLMFERGLRDTVKDTKARYDEAAALMDHYMVHYSQTSRPMVYNKVGAVIGGAAAPMKTYSHNLYGQFFEYMKGAKQGDIGPLSTFVGTQVLVAGLKGTVLVGEAAAVIAAINWFNAQRGAPGNPIPSPEEWMLTSGMSDKLVYGGMSTITGQDMTMSVGASPLTQLLSLPTAEFTSSMAVAAFNYVTKAITGTDTNSDRMRLALALSPNALHGQVERYFTEEGHPVPSPYDPQGRGNYVRTERDWFMAEAGMGRSIHESRDNALNRAAKAELLYHEEVKTKLLDAIGDRVKSKQPVDPEIMKAYMKEGGNPRTLTKDLLARAKQQQLDYITRQQMGRGMSPERARKMQILAPKAANRSTRISGWD